LIAGEMGKVFVDNKIRIQTLREQGLGYKTTSSLCESWGRTLWTRLQI